MRAGALALLAIVGIGASAGAAALLLHGSPAPASRPHVATAAPLMPGRIAVTPAQLREAVAAGVLDRPIKTLLDVGRPLQYGEYRWDDRGVPAGPTWVRVDLHSQILSVFRAGHEIGTAVILYGADSKETPVGTYPVRAKLRDHRSATYDNAPMPYTLRLTDDGVSIHGSDVRWGYATHGCIGVPLAFAAKLFGAVAPGDPVVILSGRPVGPVSA